MGPWPPLLAIFPACKPRMLKVRTYRIKLATDRITFPDFLMHDLKAFFKFVKGKFVKSIEAQYLNP